MRYFHFVRKLFEPIVLPPSTYAQIQYIEKCISRLSTRMSIFFFYFWWHNYPIQNVCNLTVVRVLFLAFVLMRKLYKHFLIKCKYKIGDSFLSSRRLASNYGILFFTMQDNYIFLNCIKWVLFLKSSIPRKYILLQRSCEPENLRVRF